ncbi:Rhodanese-like protein [Hypoxylon trugodes]|uniref:Rhodanese-like protein n=1 Tax=Hypoxylon trugodes TaxID=326681 RepID=UPI00219854CA|nr:Rhodanese-like protein [Hypoxylon trugodes]KAI1393084.1 Rhodanese-like protein [Hypoxylon trugodes]
MTDGSVFSSFLVSPDELLEALRSSHDDQNQLTRRLIPLCATWFLSTDGRKGIDSFKQKRIQNSRFFDLDKVVDPNTSLPHMLPSALDFAACMSALGIRRTDVIVVYDSYELGIFSAPRVAWTLQVFGHEHVHILNNFRLWLNGGYPTVSGDWDTPATSSYPTPKKNEYKVVSFEELRDHFLINKENGNNQWQILDTRAEARWSGKAPELRPELASGHMPGSFNLLLSDVLDPNTRAFLPGEEIRAVLERKGINPQRPIVTSCGSGVTAAILTVALREARYGDEDNQRLYDGSWREWGQRAIDYEGLIIRS